VNLNDVQKQKDGTTTLGLVAVFEAMFKSGRISFHRATQEKAKLTGIDNVDKEE
jgi:hypothetical protein